MNLKIIFSLALFAAPAVFSGYAWGQDSRAYSTIENARTDGMSLRVKIFRNGETQPRYTLEISANDTIPYHPQNEDIILLVPHKDDNDPEKTPELLQACFLGEACRAFKIACNSNTGLCVFNPTEQTQAYQLNASSDSAAQKYGSIIFR